MPEGMNRPPPVRTRYVGFFYCHLSSKSTTEKYLLMYVRSVDEAHICVPTKNVCLPVFNARDEKPEGTNEHLKCLQLHCVRFVCYYRQEMLLAKCRRNADRKCGYENFKNSTKYTKNLYNIESITFRFLMTVYSFHRCDTVLK